ncbi:hypothetical protein AVEN_101573-1 [Araneus ventricosus]|uniref:Uncharacterized protein n=1 Tax=Araneus ventricosus TaxID=182803 RepID=A0A4Y2NCE0_ARAVE|nr:hypothetical protein AVEN_101573-1 [Araneus ventricosus]
MGRSIPGRPEERSLPMGLCFRMFAIPNPQAPQDCMKREWHLKKGAEANSMSRCSIFTRNTLQWEDITRRSSEGRHSICRWNCWSVCLAIP